MYLEVEAKTNYEIKIEYDHSVVNMHSFSTCPHILLEISLISSEELQKLTSEINNNHQVKSSADSVLDIKRALNDDFDQQTLIEPSENLYSFNSYKGKEWEVISRNDFTIKVKRGLYFEVFYSPYFDEVLQVAVVQNAPDGLELSRAIFKASKSIWIELDPANYTLEVMLYRQVKEETGYELIQYQVYLQYLPVSASREVFLPESLNYFGLLGHGLEQENFNQATLFYDDLALWHEFRETSFSVKQKTLLAVKLQQIEQSVTVKLYLRNHTVVGSYSSDVSVMSEQLISAELQPGVEYVLQLAQGELNTKSLVQAADTRDETSPSFSLKLDFAVVSSSKKIIKSELPIDISQVAKVRNNVPVGLKESPFYLGTREIVQLFDNTISLNAESPYEPLSQKIYQAPLTSTEIVLSLPFTVENSEVVYASITDLSYVASLDLAIFSDVSRDEIQVSEQGKYSSQISMQVLPKGTYYLVVRTNLNIPVKFTLDVVRKIEQYEEPSWQVDFVQTIQMCPAAVPPVDTLNKIGYLHTLSGYSMLTQIPLNVLALGSGLNLPVRVIEDSLLIAYIEVSEEMEVALAIQEKGGIKKHVAISSDQDIYQTNFIKQEGFQHKKVVELRTFVQKGEYQISAQHVSYENPNLSFDQQENLCQTYLLQLSVQPLTSATQVLNNEDHCENEIGLPPTLKLQKLTRSQLVSEMNSLSMQVSAIDTTSLKSQGPFLLYFQLEYDMYQEGVMALVLSKYDVETKSFQEVGTSSLMEGQASLIQVIEKSTYVLSVQPIASSKHKFHMLGQVDHKVDSQCFKANYTYLIDIIDQDSEEPGIFNFMLSLLGVVPQMDLDETLTMLETSDDLQNLQQFVSCVYSHLPQVWPLTDSGFDRQLTLRISNNAKDISIIPIEETSLIKIFIQTHSIHNKVSIRLEDKISKKLIASNEPGTGLLSAIIDKQMDLVIVYDKLDQSDQCPLFDLRVATQSISDLSEEDLRCAKHELPPRQISIDEPSFKLNKVFAFSSDYIESFSDKDKKVLNYDIKLDFAHNDYAIDVELKTDFLTSSLKMILLAKDSESEKYHRVAISKWVNEETEEEFTSAPVDLSQAAFVQRFKFIEDKFTQKLNQTSNLVLMLSMGQEEMTIINQLESSKKLKEPVCFNFELSIYAEQKEEKVNQNQFTVHRVEISPSKIDKRFDVREKLGLFVEFTRPMRQEVKEGLMYLQLAGASNYQGKVYPSEVRIKHDDEKVIALIFKPNSLQRGSTYDLKFQGFLTNIKYQFQLQTSKCACNQVGTSRCEEDDVQANCICHSNFVGSDCTKCAKGFAMNDQGFCVKESFCFDQGGKEDCQGHGTCVQLGGIARCDCEDGFANNGMIQCGRCADPIMIFPNECSMKRKWIIKSSEVDCQQMPYEMPHNLTIDGADIESQAGFLQWQGRYSLKSQVASRTISPHVKKDQIRSRTEHSFVVDQPSVFRLHLRSQESFIGLKYQIILDGSVLFSAKQYQSHFLDFDQIMPCMNQQTGCSSSEFKLVIEYVQIPQHESKLDMDEEDFCPSVEVNFVVESISQHSRELKCTDEELKTSRQVQNQSVKKFSESKVETYNVVLNSGLEVMPDQLTNSEDEYFVYSTVKFEVEESGNVLSAFTSYRLADLTVYMTLRRVDDNQVIAIDTTEVLDTTKGVPEDNDMLAFIQIPSLQQGKYQLEISVPKGHWLYTRQFETCVRFIVSLEYWRRATSQSESNNPGVRITGVYPSSKFDLELDHKLEIHLSSFGDLNQLTSHQAQVQLTPSLQSTTVGNPICRLYSTVDNKFKIAPTDVQINPSRALLLFDFNKTKGIKNNDCFFLVCDDPSSKASLFLNDQFHEFCFGTSPKPLCNPYAKAKHSSDGKCICPSPYTDSLCESCIAPSQAIQMKKGPIKHTLCSALNEICNGFGQMRNGKCECDKDHTGENCEKCANEQFAYPDCSGDYLADVTSSKYIQKFDENRRQQVYTDKPRTQSEFSQECKSTDYPQTLNSIELHSQFLTGNFHISDIFMVNHAQDNVIEFKPKIEGILKVLVKQPELYEVQYETFDLQVGIYNQKLAKYISTSQNRRINIGTFGVQRLDYSEINLVITKDLVNETLFIDFRATNYTQPDSADCQQLYIELEFRSKETQPTCSETQYLNEFERRLTNLKLHDIKEFTSINTVMKSDVPVFWQDFFISEDDAVFVLNLEQKFIEPSTIVPLIEVVTKDLTFDDFSYQLFPLRNNEPECKYECHFIGHKTYNKFTIEHEFAKGTVIRIWFLNLKSRSTCLNFKMNVKLYKIQEEQLQDVDEKCSLAAALQPSLNSDRYLGSTGKKTQSDFRYIENVVLNKQGSFVTKFTLKESTEVVIRGMDRDFDFLVSISQNNKVIATSKTENQGLPFTISIAPQLFVVLIAGDYEMVFHKTKHQPECNSFSVDLSMSRTSKKTGKNVANNPLSLTSLMLANADTQFSYTPQVDPSEAYTVLLSIPLVFDSQDGQSLLFQTAGDVEFALLNPDSKHVYYPQFISETSKKLLIENLPISQLQLIIFVHNFANGYQLNQKTFSANLTMYSFDEAGISILKSGQISKKMHQKLTTPERLACIAASDIMPNKLSQNTLLKVPIGPDFSSSQKFIYNSADDDCCLRVVIEDSFDMSLSLHGQVLAKSKTDSKGSLSELVAMDLKPGLDYELQLNKNEMHAFLWNQECRVLKLTTASYKIEELKNNNNQKPQESHLLKLTENVYQQIAMMSGIHNIMQMDIMGDLEISVDLSQSINMPTVHLFPAQKAEDKVKGVVQIKLKQEAIEFQSDDAFFKKMIVVRYFDVPKGTYSVKLTLPQPASFETSLRVSRLSSNKNQTRASEFFQAKVDDVDGIHRSSHRLPLNLDSIQFLQQEQELYLLYSDLIVLHEDQSQNSITFKVQDDGTLVRIYIEQSSIQIVHKIDGVESSKTYKSFNKKLAKGQHTIMLVQGTNGVNLKTQITISVVSPQVLNEYQSYHKLGLSQCPMASFPLALENDKSVLTDTEAQSYYNYPHLRFPQLNYGSPTVTTYYFRFNETQRFYFEVGSHFLSNHLTLKFSKMNSEWVQNLSGKQRGNLNFVDTMVAPGDYQLRIILFASTVDQCGIYKLKGLLNTISAMMMSSEGKSLHSKATTCQIKGDFMPDMIFQSLVATKNGNEDVILQDGSFLKFYNDVLVDAQKEAWNHKIQIEVPDKSIIQITLVARNINLYTIRLVNNAGVVKTPFHFDTIQTSAGSVKETTIAWSVEPGQVWFIELIHRSNKGENKANQCNYFDLIFSITTLNYLKSKHKCVQGTKRLLDVLPEKISQSQLPLNLTGLYQISYPADFEELQGSKLTEADFNNTLVIDTFIESSSEYQISMQIWQEQSLSNFQIILYDETEQTDSDEPFSITTQTPLNPISASAPQIVGRFLPQTEISSRRKTRLLIQERISYSIFSKLLGQNDLCLNFRMSLVLKPMPKTLASKYPLLKSFEFLGQIASSNIDITRFEQTTTSVYLNLENGVPSSADDIKQAFLLQLMVQGAKPVITFKASGVEINQNGVMLDFNPKLDSVKELVMNHNQEWFVRLVYQSTPAIVDVTSKQKFEPSVLFQNQLDSQIIVLKPYHNAVIKAEINQKQSGVEKPSSINDVEIQNIAKTLKLNEVKCLCVHGTCKQGESLCNKCEKGWKGTLCDLPLSVSLAASKIVQADDSIFTRRTVSDAHVNEDVQFVARKSIENVEPQKRSQYNDYYSPMVSRERASVQQPNANSDSPWITSETLVKASVFMLLGYALYLWRLWSLEQQEQERRKQKRNDYEGIIANEEEGQDEEVVPLELEVINRKQKSRMSVPKPQTVTETEKSKDEVNISEEIENALAEFSDEGENDLELENVPEFDIQMDSDDDEFGQFI